LAAVDPQAAELVKLRYFAGLTIKQAAQALGVSPRTADLIWAYSKAWLLQKVQGDGPASPADDADEPSNS
jgi:DNA-directed RNA polymerase specialized sigma24 family protein